jgi:outer membrane immunogenic protein
MQGMFGAPRRTRILGVTKVRRIGLAAFAVSISIAATSCGASAEDWSGLYLGANLGGVWGNSDATSTVTCPANAAVAYFCSTANVSQANGPAVSNAGTGSLNDDNVIGGGQLGYNLQDGGFVYGFEVDLSAFDLGASRQVSGNYPVPFGGGVPGNTFTIGTGLATNWLFTTRGRFGWTVSNMLLYATGGLALTDLKVTSSFRDNLAPGAFVPGASMFASDTEVKAGWTIGGGLEWAFSGGWTLRGEYLYVDFGSVDASGVITNVSFPGGSNPLRTSEDLSAHIARAGINYRFNGPY